MKQFIKPITFILTTALLIVACSSTDEAPDPSLHTEAITIGNLTVAGEGATRTTTPWTPQYESFAQNDELTVVVSNATNPVANATYQYQPDASWKLKEGITPLYKNDYTDDHTFAAQKGLATLAEIADQSTLALYRLADRIEGALQLSGNQLVTPANQPLQHQHVDVVINVSPAAGSQHWAGVDFAAHMTAATVQFIAQDGTTEIIPYLATVAPQVVTYRATLPLANIPATGQNIISIQAPGTQPLTGKLPTLSSTPTAGTRITINMAYDNKRLLTTTATIDEWKTAPDYNIEINPYDIIIRTADDLFAFAKLVNRDELANLNVIQVADIDLEGKEWTPIGHYTIRFAGIYNGAGHTITGLKITGNYDEQGLFRYTEGATLTGINLINPSINGQRNIGALVGLSSTGTHISNCSVQGGTIEGFSDIGALVGQNRGTIAACYADNITVTATDNTAGGLVGWNELGTIAYSYATGTVNTPYGKGALVGVYNGGTIASCYAITTDALNIYGGNFSSNEPESSSTSPTDAGATVRAYTGSVTVPIGPGGITRTINADIWEKEAAQPKLIWSTK